MIGWQNLFSILLLLLIFGCSVPTTAKSAATTSRPQTIASATSGQTLPISATAAVPKGKKIKLEVARTPQQQAMGLMYRPALPNDRGMLFVFSPAQPVSFWMKNVPVSLDMVFLRNGIVKYIQVSAPPCASEPCPTYGPNTLIDNVIELRSGRAAELGLKVGNRVKIEFLETNALQK